MPKFVIRKGDIGITAGAKVRGWHLVSYLEDGSEEALTKGNLTKCLITAHRCGILERVVFE
jgi:hypothetical protein